jgi:hypothetical protein
MIRKTRIVVPFSAKALVVDSNSERMTFFRDSIASLRVATTSDQAIGMISDFAPHIVFLDSDIEPHGSLSAMDVALVLHRAPACNRVYLHSTAADAVSEIFRLLPRAIRVPFGSFDIVCTSSLSSQDVEFLRTIGVAWSES